MTYYYSIISFVRGALATADLKVFVCDSSDDASKNAMAQMVHGSKQNTIILFNKTDLVGNDPSLYTTDSAGIVYDTYSMSCASGAGVREFELVLECYVHAALSPNYSDSIKQGVPATQDLLSDRLTGITRQRHRFHIEQCVRHLSRFMVGLDALQATEFEDGGGDIPMLLDVKAEELR